jgi:AcrR family transcriptional regulator
MAGRKSRKTEPIEGELHDDCASKTHYHHGNLGSALVEAGLEILAEDGIEALGLRSTARRAGVSQAAPYHHFGSKEGLLAAVAAEGLRRMAIAQQQAVRDVVPTEEEPSLRVRTLGISYVRFARANPELFRLMFGPLLQNREAYPELVQAYAEGYGYIESATAEYLAARGAREISVKVAVSGAWAIVHGLAHLLIDGKIRPGEDLPDEDELVDRILSLLNDGMTGWITEEQATKAG